MNFSSSCLLSFGILVAVANGCSSTATGNPGNTSTGGDGGGTEPGTRSSGDGGGGKSDGGSAASKFTCCLNDVYYKCPDKAATDKCAFGGFDIDGCMSACGADPSCFAECQDKLAHAKPDPSQCTKQVGEKCPATPTKPLCANVGSGSCEYDHQCDSGEHCTGGSCYASESGSKCEYDHQCGSGGHCTDGCCQDNATGTTCQYDHQCGSGNHCTDNKCHPNEAGSPCEYDHQCGSGGTCSGGTCD